jgi:PDZ domain
MGSLYAGNRMSVRYGDRPTLSGERLVIVEHRMLNHTMLKVYRGPHTTVLAEINGVRVRNRSHSVRVRRDANGPYVEFTFDGRPANVVVFNRKEVNDATAEILADNGIGQLCEPDTPPVWNSPKKAN